VHKDSGLEEEAQRQIQIKKKLQKHGRHRAPLDEATGEKPELKVSGEVKSGFKQSKGTKRKSESDDFSDAAMKQKWMSGIRK
jgi:hypothetical protein